MDSYKILRRSRERCSTCLSPSFRGRPLGPLPTCLPNTGYAALLVFITDDFVFGSAVLVRRAFFCTERRIGNGPKGFRGEAIRITRTDVVALAVRDTAVAVTAAEGEFIVQKALTAAAVVIGRTSVFNIALFH